MRHSTRKVLQFILKLTSEKSSFFFWLFIRFLSAFFPLITIYQFSHLVKLLETHTVVHEIMVQLFLVLIVRLLDNYTRLLSTTRLDYAISNINFDIHNFFLRGLNSQTRQERFATVQAIRNFSDASNLTLSLIKQPGIDSLVSLFSIPLILFTQNLAIFIFSVAYILIYYFIDVFTTQKYARLKNVMDLKTESYYGKLQDSVDFDLEQRAWTRHYDNFCHWGFVEWSLLQNFSVISYLVVLGYLVFSVYQGLMDISGLILIYGYLSQIQPNLNSFSQIKDSLTDMMVGLHRLASNHAVPSVNLEDLL